MHKFPCFAKNIFMEKKKTKVSVKESWYIFAVVALSALLLLSLWLFLQNPFITNKPTTSGLIPLGTPTNISVEDNGSSTQALFFYGSLLPNFLVPQDVNITLKSAESPCAVRAKVFMFNEQNQVLPVNAQVATNWQQSPDGYFYCAENLTPNLVLDFLQAVEIPGKEASLNAENVYALLVSVETLPLTTDFNAVWKLN